MFAGGDLGFFVGHRNEGAAGAGIGATGQTSRALMDGQNRIVGKQVLGKSGNLEVMFEVPGHIFKFEGVQMRSPDDSEGQGLGCLIHELVEQVILASQDDREDGLRVEVELGEGLEFGEDFESHEVGLVDDQDGGHFLEPDVEKDAADGLDEPGDGDEPAVVIQRHSNLAVDFDGRAGGGMGPGVIIILNPFGEMAVVDVERKPVGRQAEELLADGMEPAFDLAPAFGLIRFGMDQGDPQRGDHVAEMARGEGGAGGDIEFPGQTPFGQGMAQGIGIGFDPFVEIELGMGDDLLRPA